MKIFNRILAFALCAVMVFGIVPVAFNEGNTVTALTTPSGVIQGTNDLVIRYNQPFDSDLPELHILPAYIMRYATDEAQANSAGLPYAQYDRIIILFAQSTTLTVQTATAWETHVKLYTNSFNGSEKFVFTQKCYIQNPELVYDFTSGTYAGKDSARTTGVFAKAEGVVANSTLNYYDSDNESENVTISLPTEAKFKSYTDDSVERTALTQIKFVLGCDVTFDYIRFNFTTSNPFFFCQGFDLTIGENVEFIAASEVYRPIVINGTYVSTTNNASFHGKHAGSDSYNTQSITLLGGQYQYVSPRSRNANSDVPSGKTINIHLGNVEFNTAGESIEFLGNDDFNLSTVNVTIDGATFKNYVYIFGGTTFAAGEDIPSADGATVNIYYKSATIDKYFVGVRRFESGSTRKMLTHNGAKTNVYVLNSVKGNGLRGNYLSGGVGEISGLTTSVYYNPAFADATSDFKYFDNYYTYSMEDSTVEHKCGEASEGANVIKYVDSNGVLQANEWNCKVLEAHTYHAGLIGDTPVYMCENCYDNALQLDDNGKPVVYINSTLADDEGHSGLAPEEPFEKLGNAFSALAKWGMGGTVVITGPCYFFGSDYGLTHNNLNLTDAGDTVTITSVFNDVDYRDAWEGDDPLANVAEANKHENTKTGDACWITVGYTKFNNDIVIDGIDFIATNSKKTWFMNYNDLIITENNRTFALSGGFKDDNHPVKGEGDPAAWLAITAGSARADSATVGTGDFGEQTIDLRHGYIWQVINGNKYCNDAKLGCGSITDHTDAPVCDTTVYIHEGVEVIGIDTTSLSGWDTDMRVYFVDNTPNIVYRTYAGSGYIDEDGDLTNVEILVSEDQLATTAERIYVYDADFFGTAQHGNRLEPEKNGYAARLTYTTSAEWVDTNGVTEFGVLMSTAANKANIAYVSVKSQAVNGVAKSVAYDDELRNYIYDGKSDVVTFRGTLVYDGATAQSQIGTAFAAAPYAVVPATDNVGYYTVIGETTVFNYNGIIAD